MQRPQSRIKAQPLSRLKAMPREGGANASFYQSPEWRALRAAVVAERGRRCERCGAVPTGRIHCDHVVELIDGGAPLDRRNIVLLCVPCHNRKTSDMRRGRRG
jgi:5-methylcytosine-specific restriction protein A